MKVVNLVCVIQFGHLLCTRTNGVIFQFLFSGHLLFSLSSFGSKHAACHHSNEDPYSQQAAEDGSDNGAHSEMARINTVVPAEAKRHIGITLSVVRPSVCPSVCRTLLCHIRSAEY